MKWFWDAYATDPSSGRNPRVTAARRHRELRRLPPPWSSSTRTSAARRRRGVRGQAAEAGVNVTAVRYLSTIHDFLLLNPIASTSPTRSALDQIVATIRPVIAN